MAQGGLSALLSWLQVLQPAFTQPGFANMVVLFPGWVRTNGPHAVTQALVFAEVAGHRHHEAFHRFFSRGAWVPDQLGRLLFQLIVRMLPEDRFDPKSLRHAGPFAKSRVHLSSEHRFPVR